MSWPRLSKDDGKPVGMTWPRIMYEARGVIDINVIFFVGTSQPHNKNSS